MRCLIIIGLMIGLLGCDDSIDGVPEKSSENAKKKVDQAVEAVGNFADEQKTKLVDTVKSSLADLDTQLGSLKEKGSKLTEDTKANWEVKQTELEAQRMNLQEKLDELSDSPTGTWMEMKEGVMSAWIELKNSLNDAAREFKDD